MQLEDAIILAATKHRGQRDKIGQPYVLHPLRVALRLDDDRARLAAVLHDILEDTDVTSSELRGRGVPEDVLHAIEALTRRLGEDYMAFIERLLVDPIARAVKIADLRDNLDPARLAGLADEERQRLRAKYQPALARLEAI